MDKNTIIKEFVDFVEGRMAFGTFQKNYETNPDYFKILDDDKPNEKFVYQKGKTLNQCLQIYKWSTVLGRLSVHSYIVRYLTYYNIPIKPTSHYLDERKFRIDVQPSYVSIDDEDFFNSIVALIPIELTTTQKKKWLKEKIKSLFKCDDKPPRWIQDPEWPIIDGKPLVFKRQTKELKNDERVYYTFYNTETGKETVVMQSY